MSAIPKRARLLLAEDHEMVGEGFKSMLTPHYDIVGIVVDGAQITASVEQHRPDLLLLDLTMPNRSGLEVLDDLQSIHPGVRVLVVTMHADHVMMEAAMGLGAAGFIPKDSNGEELRSAIEEVLAGRRYVSPRIPKHGHRGGSAAQMGFLRLTPRQQELVLMIGRGMTSAQMAGATGLSHWTIDFHRKNIRRVLGIHTDLEMYRYAVLVALSEKEASGASS
jgi:DNA-binding NarL/FixJ family response regulator